MLPEEQLGSRTIYMIGSKDLGVGADTQLNIGNSQDIYMYLDFDTTAHGTACIEDIQCTHCSGCTPDFQANTKQQWEEVSADHLHVDNITHTQG